MGIISRQHKDNVFCLLYQDRGRLLSLYNAVNDSNYTEEEELTVVTLEGAICMQMRNDAAFVIDSRLNLYEQQSTVNPNMPLRDLFYVADELRKLVPQERLYKKVVQKIPSPRFVVFYNGKEKCPSRSVLKLSDMYEKPDESPELELTVTVLNINAGYNDSMLAKCESLCGYMAFVEKVRRKQAAGMTVEHAVAEAAEDCIRENILAEFFTEHKKEVVEVGIYEYDAELHDKALLSDGYEIGHAEGLAAGRAEGLAAGRAEGLTEGQTAYHAAIQKAKELVKSGECQTEQELTAHGIPEDVAKEVLELINLNSGKSEKSIYEYDAELHDKAPISDGYEVGHAEGLEAGRAAGLAEGHATGHATGLEKGEYKKLITLIIRKLQKSKMPEQIAEELDEDIDTVRSICDVARRFAPDYDETVIYDVWKKSE